MVRRSVLKGVMFGGMVFAGEQVAGPDPAEAKGGPKGQFFTGSLSGENFKNWPLTIGIAGTRARGFARDPEATEEADASLAMSGRLKKGKLVLTLFTADDRRQQTPLGTLQAKIRGSKLTGGLSLTGGSEGTCTANQVRKHAALSRSVAGTYDGEITEGEEGFKAVVKVKSNGTFEAGEFESGKGKKLPGRVAGVFVISAADKDATYWMTLPRASASGLLGDPITSCPCCNDENRQERYDRQQRELNQMKVRNTGDVTSLDWGGMHGFGIKR